MRIVNGAGKDLKEPVQAGRRCMFIIRAPTNTQLERVFIDDDAKHSRKLQAAGSHVNPAAFVYLALRRHDSHAR